MSDRAFTAHAPLRPIEARAVLLAWFDELGLELAHAEDDLLIAWVDDSIDPADEGFAGTPTLVVEAQIHPLQEGVQLRCCVRHGEGRLDALLAAETDRGLAHCLAVDGRWVVDGCDRPRS